MEGLNDIAVSVDRLYGTVRNSERNPGPLKGVGNGLLFPNNPLGTYPAPAQEVGQTWWRFFHQGRNIDYFYDFTQNRWLSTERFIGYLGSRNFSCDSSGQVEQDLIAVPSGVTNNIAVVEIYYTVLSTGGGAHTGTDHFIVTVQGFDPVLNTTTVLHTTTTDTFLVNGTALTLTQTLYIEQASGSVISFLIEQIGAPTGVALTATVCYRQIG